MYNINFQLFESLWHFQRNIPECAFYYPFYAFEMDQSTFSEEDYILSEISVHDEDKYLSWTQIPNLEPSMKLTQYLAALKFLLALILLILYHLVSDNYLKASLQMNIPA